MISKDKKSKQIDAGLHKAVENAIKQHKLLGQSIAVWQEGKVVVLPAKKIKTPKKKK